MIGIIAGEIIGSPYRRENLKAITDIFFPLFEPHVVIDPKTFRERTYRPSPGRISDTALRLLDLTDLSHINRDSLAECLAGAIVLGDLDAVGQMGFDAHADIVRQYSRWFPEERHAQIFRAANAAYRLRRGLGASIEDKLGTALDRPVRPEILSALLKGQLADDGEGAYTPGDGRYSDSHMLDAAFCSVSSSSSFEEAVRRATALGGDSAGVAAITGGLAELAFGMPDAISYRVREMLDREQTALLAQHEAAVRLFSGNDEDTKRAVGRRTGGYTELSVLSLQGKARVYCIPEGRTDIENAVRKVSRDSVIVRPEDMRGILERVSVRKDGDGGQLSGTYIDSVRPELRHLYFYHKDGKLYSPSSLPVSGDGFPPLEERLKARSDFMQFIERAEEIREMQERRAGHDPAEGHLRFATAWYLEIERDRVALMKGDVRFGEFGLDRKGRMTVNSNVIGGSHGGEYLQAALDNQIVFYHRDNPNEILSKISEKCLDSGYIPSPEDPVPSNLDLMSSDLAMAPLQLPRAAEVTDEVFSERSSGTRHRYDYASSSEVRTIDEAIHSKTHRGAVFTIGHSNLSIDAFVGNCRRNGITVVRDVRSWPYSKSFPHFNREDLRKALEGSGIRYIFNGDTMGGHLRRTEFPSEADGVRFTCSQGGYAVRTRENARAADLTLAFAVNFDTAGERVTAEAARGSIIRIPLCDGAALAPGLIAGNIVCCMTGEEKSRPLTINIAGNGICTLSASGIGQDRINSLVTDVIRNLVDSGISVRKIISGGQSGADEAGIIAAKALSIPAEVHAPKGWMMRREDNRDIFSEYEFKSRFARMPERDLSYTEMMATEGFRKTYDEIVESARSGERQALMCAETTPTNCHRFACIGFALEHPSEAGRRYAPTEVQHIMRDGQTVAHSALERSLCAGRKIEYNEKNVAGMMKKFGEQIQHPDLQSRPVSMKGNHGRKP